MSEWKKQVKDKAMYTAVMYVLENGGAASAASATAAGTAAAGAASATAAGATASAAKAKAKKRSGSDRIFGFFAVFMAIAMALIAAGFYATAGEFDAAAGYGIAVAYLVLCIVMMVSGIRSIVKSLR